MGLRRNEFFSLADLRQQGFEAALPGHLDGEENIYYGVPPRSEPRLAESGTDCGAAVSQADTLWLDEITCPAPDLPPVSWMVEASVGKVPAGYLPKETTADLDRRRQCPAWTIPLWTSRTATRVVAPRRMYSWVWPRNAFPFGRRSHPCFRSTRHIWSAETSPGPWPPVRRSRSWAHPVLAHPTEWTLLLWSWPGCN